MIYLLTDFVCSFIIVNYIVFFFFIIELCVPITIWLCHFNYDASYRDINSFYVIAGSLFVH